MEQVLDVRLQHFEGPLDLLLSLIEKNKKDIYDIPIAEITDQYLETIRQMKEEDPELASSFLVMAATLLEIKSRMLLPGSPEFEDEEFDPRAELVEQLTTYRIYKEAAQKLSGLEVPGGSALYRKMHLPGEIKEYREPVDVDAVLDELTLRRLSEMFQDLMRRREESVDPLRSSFGKIRQEKMTLAERMDQVRDYFHVQREVSFETLVEETGGGRTGMVMTFLSVLELAKEGFLLLKVGKDSRDIAVSRREDD